MLYYLRGEPSKNNRTRCKFIESRRILWQTKTPGIEIRKRIRKKVRQWAPARAVAIRVSRDRKISNRLDADLNQMKSRDKAEAFKVLGKVSQIRVDLLKASTTLATNPGVVMMVRA
jgi:hypothetical protein